MKLKSLYALLFCIFMTGCLDGQKQSDHSILIAYMSTEYPELGSSVCYLNEQGDTIVPLVNIIMEEVIQYGISVL